MGIVVGLRLTEQEAALAGQDTGVGLDSSETQSGDTTARREWHVTSLRSLSRAEDLLDCLEAQGFAERELIVLGDEAFAVRWR